MKIFIPTAPAVLNVQEPVTLRELARSIVGTPYAAAGTTPVLFRNGTVTTDTDNFLREGDRVYFYSETYAAIRSKLANPSLHWMFDIEPADTAEHEEEDMDCCGNCACCQGQQEAPAPAAPTPTPTPTPAYQPTERQKRLSRMIQDAIREINAITEEMEDVAKANNPSLGAPKRVLMDIEDYIPDSVIFAKMHSKAHKLFADIERILNEN